MELGQALWHTASNPAEGVPKIRKPRMAKEVNRPWTAEEFALVMAALPPTLRIAMALGAFAGLRQGDALSIQWSSYDGRIIQSRQLKTGDPVWVPAHTQLKELLVAEQTRRNITPDKRHETIVVGSHGRPFTTSGFRASFFKVIRKLRSDGQVSDGLTFHGLRHTAATMLADAGCDTRDIMAITGHKTEAMVRRYTEPADRKRRAESDGLKATG